MSPFILIFLGLMCFGFVWSVSYNFPTAFEKSHFPLKALIFLITFEFFMIFVTYANAKEVVEGGNTVVNQNEDVYRLPLGQVHIGLNLDDLSGDRYRGNMSALDLTFRRKFTYYVDREGDGSYVPVYDRCNFSSFVSGTYVNDSGNRLTMFIDDFFLIRSNNTESIPMIVTEDYVVYVQLPNGGVGALESDAPFLVNKAGSKFFVSSDSPMQKYEYDDGWKALGGSFFTDFETDFIFRFANRTLDYIPVYTDTGFSFFNFAFKHELDEGEDIPAPTPSPIPDVGNNNYFSFIQNNLGGKFLVRKGIDSNTIYCFKLYDDTYERYGYLYNVGSRYEFDATTYALTKTWSYNDGLLAYSSSSVYYCTFPYTSEYNLFNSSVFAEWPFLPTSDESVATPSPIPTFIPTATPSPTPTNTPPPFVSDFPFPTGALTPPPSVEVKDYLDSVHMPDVSAPFGLFGYAISFVPQELVNMAWVYVGLLVVCALILIFWRW